MGWTDFIDEKVADGLGSLAAGLGELGEQASDAIGLPDWVGNSVDSLGEGSEYLLNGLGNFTTPILDGIDTGMNVLFDDVQSLGENFEQFADDPSWSNFLDQGSDFLDDVQNNAWDGFVDIAGSTADAWNETIDDANGFLDDLEDIWDIDLGDASSTDILKFGDVEGWLNDNREFIEPFTSPALTAPWLAWKQHQNDEGWFGANGPFGNFVGGGSGGGTGGGGGGGWLDNIFGPGGIFGGGGGGAGGSGGGPVSHGMNRAEAANAVESIRADREKLQSLIEDAAQAVAQLGENWEGGDSARFREDFNGKRQAMQQAVQMLESMAKQLQQQIGQQQSTSNA